jgi:hypothetical protein
MQPKTHMALDRAIAEGVLIGYRRAFKRVEEPTEMQIVAAIEEAVTTSIYEWFDI